MTENNDNTSSVEKDCCQDESEKNVSIQQAQAVIPPQALDISTQSNGSGITLTFSVECFSGPFVISKTNGDRERYVNIRNTGECSIDIFSADAAGNPIAGSTQRVPRGATLTSYISAAAANQVLFRCRQGTNPCTVSLTICC
ncbi:hypothetical protein F9802_03115 [Bacillus aerolatus]|uniref:Uncharacterized protein n=1 Tax=Bacillus aerolatus TaxID=2653354 RepID=A0A6I1FKB6_9BACI|nr:hypothetical protein [Bacillus aerolatus]KAB7709115.1 hypothetical protein F9802_03115 [Bacillus aerolatus]